jgi:hypothetical protein
MNLFVACGIANKIAVPGEGMLFAHGETAQGCAHRHLILPGLPSRSCPFPLLLRTKPGHQGCRIGTIDPL